MTTSRRWGSKVLVPRASRSSRWWQQLRRRLEPIANCLRTPTWTRQWCTTLQGAHHTPLSLCWQLPLLRLPIVRAASPSLLRWVGWSTLVEGRTTRKVVGVSLSARWEATIQWQRRRLLSQTRVPWSRKWTTRMRMMSLTSSHRATPLLIIRWFLRTRWTIRMI